MLAALLLCVFALTPPGLRAATNELSSALQTGLFEEEANRNLPAAIEAYERVAKQFDQNRALAATAIFRLGEVNRKLGKTNEAAAFYQRILREFSDQDTLANLSRQNLAGMNLNTEAKATLAGAGKARGNGGMLGSLSDISAAALREAEAEAAKLEMEVKQLQAMSREDFRRVAQQNYPNPVLIKLLQDLAAAEQQVVVISKDFGPESSTVINANALVKTIEKQIDAQLEGVLLALQVKRDAAAATAKTLRERTGQSSTAQSNKSSDAPITAVLDEEETEIRRIQAMIQNSPDLINAPASGPSGGLYTTPLCRAAGLGQLRVARFLIENGAAVDQKAASGSLDVMVTQGTALHVAAVGGHRAMVELLLQRGASVNAASKDGYTALHVAAQKGFQSVAEALLNGKADLNAGDKGGSTPLHQAARAGHPGLVTFLITKGADVNAADESGWTPLMLATGQGHGDVVKALLAAKANVDAQEQQGRTALSYAAEKGHAEIVKALLAAKADPNAGKVNLPLHYAIRSKSAGIVEALLRAGADANRANKLTWSVRSDGGGSGVTDVTPMALAMNYIQLDVVKLLLAHKADPNGKRVDGGPLIFSAVNDAELTKAFLDAGAKPNVEDNNNPPRTPLIATTNPKVASLLLAAGADPEARYYGMTALMYGVDAGNKATVEALLKGGANVNAAAPGGSTALHLATRKQNSAMASLLLEYKADVNARDDAGLTPLDLASGKGQQMAIGSGTLMIGNPPPQPLSYQWHKGQDSAKAETTPVAELLRQHGGLSELPKFDRIELRRSGSFQNVIFYKGTNDWNRFTLLDVIFNNYQSGPRRGLGGGTTFADRLAAMTNPSSTSPPFPDLRRIVVVRQQPASSSKPAERIMVDLLNATNGVDCAKDIALNFGDVVEIPERLHTLQEPAVGLTPVEMAQIWACRIGVVTLIYQGKKTSLQVAGTPAEALLGSILAGEEARKALFSSADLARVKVTRHDATNGKPREWIVDCSNQDKAPDLWLRDGDVIGVPEK